MTPQEEQQLMAEEQRRKALIGAVGSSGQSQGPLAQPGQLAETQQDTSSSGNAIESGTKGAAMGASVGGPYGAVIGAAIGVGTGLLKASAKRQQAIAAINKQKYDNEGAIEQQGANGRSNALKNIMGSLQGR